MAERLKAAVLKTARGRKVSRGFESPSLRQGVRPADGNGPCRARRLARPREEIQKLKARRGEVAERLKALAC
jgi:hypothetical protein